jgi:hypothetical protein
MIEVIPHGDSGINVFKYKGQIAMQVVGVEKAFSVLAEKIKQRPIEMIIELGTDHGGLTNLLADHEISTYAKIHTFDINGDRFKSHNDKISFNHASFQSSYDYIVSLIESGGRVLLLCDGGNKKEEFATFYKFLKNNDIIMGHDYAPNQDEFINKYHGKIWNWHEFQDSYADFDGLSPFMQEEFAKYAWCIRIKD